MKRIGILTFHRSINYGAFMQAYALSSELKKRYPEHQIEIIDFEYIKKYNNYRKPLRQFPFAIEYYFKYTQFQKDLNRLPLSKESFITDKTEGLADFIKRNYDIVIVGSDAVWAYQGKMPLDNPYWLMGEKLNSIVKFSYAASAFSTDFSKIDENQKTFIKERLSDFQYIGVRDEATRDFVNSLGLTIPANLNHDPTFFLEPSSDKSMVRKVLRRNMVFSRKPAVSFMTRETHHMDEIRKKLHKEYNLLHFNRRDSNRIDVLDFRCRYLYNMSPYEWYNVYSVMSLGITNFFHGACLSLVNHCPTIVIDDSETSYVSKYSQLMLDLGFSDRLFYKRNFELDSLFACIDDCINNKEREKYRIKDAINKERLKSISFFEALDRVVK